MSMTERPCETRTGDELTPDPPIRDELIPHSPPVHPEPLLNESEPDADEPPYTQLLLEGLDREAITTAFLADLHDLAADHDLTVESISVGRPDDE